MALDPYTWPTCHPACRFVNGCANLQQTERSFIRMGVSPCSRVDQDILPDLGAWGCRAMGARAWGGMGFAGCQPVPCKNSASPGCHSGTRVPRGDVGGGIGGRTLTCGSVEVEPGTPTGRLKSSHKETVTARRSTYGPMTKDDWTLLGVIFVVVLIIATALIRGM